jgi:hypothetical protein
MSSDSTERKGPEPAYATIEDAQRALAAGDPDFLRKWARLFARAEGSAAAPAEPLRERIAGAVARGWRSPENAHKEMDATLAFAIVDEVLAALAQPVSPAPDADLIDALDALDAELDAVARGHEGSQALTTGHLRIIRRALAVSPAPEPLTAQLGLRDVATPHDEWPEDADYALGHLAGIAFGHAPSDEIGHCVALLRAALVSQPVAAPEALTDELERLRVVCSWLTGQNYHDAHALIDRIERALASQPVAVEREES